MDVTLAGIVTDFRPLQFSKELPMNLTLLGKTTDFRPLQFEKALSPIDITVLGIVKEARLLQP